MMGTAAWRTAWRAVGTRRAVALVQLQCMDGFTLRLSTCVHAPTDDGSNWDPALLSGALSSRGTFLGTDIVSSTATFQISDTPLGGASGAVMSTLLWQHDFRGARVDIWLHELSLAFSVDALHRWGGYVQKHSSRNGIVTFNAMQSRSFNGSLTVRPATRAEFPGLLEDAAGAGLPTIVGNVQGAPLRFKTPSLPYSLLNRFREKIAGGGRAAAALMVDSGRGGGSSNPPAKVMISGHRLAQIGYAGPEYGTSIFIEGEDGALHVVEPLPANIFNTDTGAGILIPDDSGTAWAPIYPYTVELVANNADNPRGILDRRNETTYARLNWALAQTIVTGLFQSSAPAGLMKNVHAYLIYRSSGDLTGASFVVSKGATAVLATIPPSTVEAAVFLDLSGGAGWGTGVLPTIPWDFSQVRISTKFFGNVPGVKGTVDVIHMGIAVEYVPAQDLSKVERLLTQVPVTRRTFGGPDAHHPSERGQPHVTYRQQELLVNVSELRGKFYANAKGLPDTDGSITGVVGGSVQTVPHVVRQILQTFGGVDAAAFNVTPGVVGNFTDALALFKTRRGNDMVLGLHMAQSVSIASAMTWICGSVAVQVYLSEFDDTWRIVPWRVAPAPTCVPLRFADLLDPEEGVVVDTAPDSDVASGFTIPYGWDAQSQSYAHAVSIGADGSSAGYKYRNMRDGIMALKLNENNKLDWSVSAKGFPVITSPAASFSATIGDGVTPLVRFPDPMGLAGQIRIAMRAADPARLYQVGCGGSIAAGVNDTLEIFDGAFKTATADPGDYDMPGMAAAYTTALNAVSTGWLITYDRPTRRFVATCTSNNTLRRTGPLRGTGGLIAMGFYNGYNPAGASTDLTIGPAATFSVYDREEDLFYIGNADTTLDINWRTGTNGLLGTKRTCAELVGFDWANDDTGGQSSYGGVCPKRDLEVLYVSANDQFGEKPQLNVDGRAIYDTDTALEARDVLGSLIRDARADVTFSTEIHADIERGDVVPCAADMNGLRDYAVPNTDGQWAGKLLRVVETSQSFGPSFHTELKCIDLTQ